jgi:two-component system chemotaxis response regulator CheY
MKILIADDDFISRKILLKHLSQYGQCDMAFDGNEALESFEYALNSDMAYDLVCLDILMPNMGGHETLKQIRDLEIAKNIRGLDRAKIIMTTVVDDINHVKTAFREGCECYLIKPIEKIKLMQKLEELELIKGCL